MNKIPNWLDGYRIKNTIKKFEETKKKFEETKAKRQQWEIKYNLSKIEELQDKLDNHDHKDSCECYKIRQEIKDLKERLHDEVISNDTDLLLSTRC